MTDHHSTPPSSRSRRRVIFPELVHRPRRGQELVPTPVLSQLIISVEKEDGKMAERSSSEHELDSSSLPSLETVSHSPLPENKNAKNISLPAVSLPSVRHPSPLRRRKIFDLTPKKLELRTPVAPIQAPVPSRRPPTRARSLPILKPSSFQRLDSIPSLESTADGDDEEHREKDEKLHDETSQRRKNKVLFHPRVSECEFERSDEEIQSTWWSPEDMQLFQIAAMAKVFGWGAPTANVKKTNDTTDDAPKKALFTHPALAA